MAKYLVTSGSYFEPFTYEQLSAPIREAAAIHRATQDTYDQIGTEAEALRRYIEQEPDDSNARRMYDSYMSKLSDLQNNLWSNGYNAQTRRDLAAARAGYASDITRLGKAIQTRQERSAEYHKYAHEHPEDAIMGWDPGLASLDEYLRDDLYGQDYFAMSGKEFAATLATDLQARANEIMSDPTLMDMNLPGYYFLKTNKGFTNQQINDATAAVRSYWSGDGGAAINALDPVTKIVADVMQDHLRTSGASGKVSGAEFDKLIGWGAVGASQTVKEPSVEHMENKQWDYQMRNWLAAQDDSRDLEKQKELYKFQHPDEFDENGNRVVKSPKTTSMINPSQYLYQQGAGVDKMEKQMRKVFGAIDPEHPVVIFNEDTGERAYDNWRDAYAAIYENEAYRSVQRKFGMDPSIYPSKGQEQTSTISGTDANGNRITLAIQTGKLSAKERERLNLTKDDVGIYELDANGNRTVLNEELTLAYNTDRRRYDKYVSDAIAYNQDRGLGGEDIIASKKKLEDLKRKNGIAMNVPNKYVESAAHIRQTFGITPTVTVVPPTNDKALTQYARELNNSMTLNDFTSDGPLAMYPYNPTTGVIDYKHPVKNKRQVLDYKKSNNELDGNGGLLSVTALPKTLITGELEDSIGKLIITTEKGSFVVDPRMFDSVVANRTALTVLAGLPDLMEPFIDPDKIFTESDGRSAARLADIYYDLGIPGETNGETMKDVMNNPKSRDALYQDILTSVQESFNYLSE